MVIYKATNKMNGKEYIGQTIRDLSVRITEHKYSAFNRTNNLPFGNAMAKYGFENFVFEEIDSASSIEELNKKEELYISKFNTLFPNGYNLDLGGNNKNTSEYTRKKQSEFRKALFSNKENHPNWRKSSAAAKSVLCLNNGKVYVSARKAALELGLDPSVVCKVCKNIYSHTKGFKFKYL